MLNLKDPKIYFGDNSVIFTPQAVQGNQNLVGVVNQSQLIIASVGL